MKKAESTDRMKKTESRKQVCIAWRTSRGAAEFVSPARKRWVDSKQQVSAGGAAHPAEVNVGTRLLFSLILTLSVCTTAMAQETQHQHSDSMHHDAMNARGEKAMGFSQTATTHHFTLLPDGGFVQVQANDANDTANRDHIRIHLQEQAKRFAAGDFSLSEMTHDRVLPGTPQMQSFKSAITYKYEEIERGARLRISSKDAAAVAAIHDFLKFQIEDHQTGDPTSVKAQ
jgi:hypothetical protein